MVSSAPMETLFSCGPYALCPFFRTPPSRCNFRRRGFLSNLLVLLEVNERSIGVTPPCGVSPSVGTRSPWPAGFPDPPQTGAQPRRASSAADTYCAGHRVTVAVWRVCSTLPRSNYVVTRSRPYPRHITPPSATASIQPSIQPSTQSSIQSYRAARGAAPTSILAPGLPIPTVRACSRGSAPSSLRRRPPSTLARRRMNLFRPNA